MRECDELVLTVLVDNYIDMLMSNSPGITRLGHAGITQAKVDRTVDELIERGPSWVSPMHCSGFRTQRAVAERMPDAFKLMTVGTEVRFAA